MTGNVLTDFHASVELSPIVYLNKVLGSALLRGEYCNNIVVLFGLGLG